MDTELFFPPPAGLPVPVHPLRGKEETLRALNALDWSQLGEDRTAELVRAGAFWLYGFLDESHRLAQEIGSAEGSYWHALMHRSEGDFSNSKYWYRRVGRHAIFPGLRVAVERLKVQGILKGTHSSLLAGHEWDPYRFVDAVERAASNQAELELIGQIVRIEYGFLMEHCLKVS